MNSKMRKRISAFLGILILSYVVHQIYQMNQSSIATEMANFATISDTVETRGFAIRDEVVVDNQIYGTVDYAVADGDRISKDDPIANIYSNKTDASTQNQINQLTKELESLENLSAIGESYVTNPGAVNDQIYQNLNKILVDVNQYKFNELHNVRDAFQTAINHKNLVTGKETVADYLPRIQEIKNKKSELENRIVLPDSVIASPEAGYFISKVDGYENIVDIKETVNLMPSQIHELLEARMEPKKNVGLGKICRAFNWYITVILSESEAIGLEGISQVKLKLPYATNQEIPAKIVGRNVDSKTNEVAVIFSCLNMNSDIARIRNESIQIILQTYSGVLVNEDSIFFNDVEYEEVDEDGTRKTVIRENVKGVYVLSGDKIEFVQIFTNKTVNGYAICKTELSEKDLEILYTEKTISLYDNVVSRADNLYDGKIV